MLEVKKISYDRKKGIVKVVYDELDGESDTKEVTFTAYDRPLESFVNALDALAQDVLTICQLPDEYGITLQVRSISLSRTNGILGAVITSLKELSTSYAPLVLNTPHLPYTPYSDGDDNAPVLPAGCKSRIENLIFETEKYINGDRSEKQEKLKLVG